MNKPFNFILIKDIFTVDELSFIWKELDFLTEPHKLLSSEETGSAKEYNDGVLKQNKGIYLDSAYGMRKLSNYLKLYEKPFVEINKKREEMCSNDPMLRSFFQSNKDYTLLSYYDESDYYRTHMDAANYTYVFYMYKEPKHFTGGCLRFDDLDITIDIENNMGILFPSWAYHSVSNVVMNNPSHKDKGLGRYCLTTFFRFV